MNLSRPTNLVFLISIILAIASVLVRYAGIDVPVVSQYIYEVLLAAFVLLAAGNLLKGL